MVTTLLKIKVESKEQLNNIKEAEQHLRDAGVTFDTGYNLKTNEREWFFDWSLNGGKLVFIVSEDDVNGQQK